MALSEEHITKIKQYIAMYDEDMLTNEYLDFAITDSVETLPSEALLGIHYDKAVALLTLHTLTIAAQTTEGGGGEGFVIQRTIGPITIKWANPYSNNRDNYNAYYRSTKYGLQLLDVLKMNSVGLGFSVNHSWRKL